MKYPNLRYGNPLELAHYAQPFPLKELAKRLRRSERSVSDWLQGRAKVPWWVPEILRLQHMERVERMRQMQMKAMPLKFRVVPAQILQFPAKRESMQEPASTVLPCAQSAFVDDQGQPVTIAIA